MKRMMRGKKGCGQILSKNTYISDSWFSGAKIYKEAIAEVVYYCRPVKTIQKGFFLNMFKKFMKEWPGGSYLIMNGTKIVPSNRPFIDI